MSSDQRRIFNAKTITNLGFGQQSRQEFYSDLIPSNDSTFDLGYSSLRWKTLNAAEAVISNNINVGGDIQVTSDVTINDKLVINSTNDSTSPTDANSSMQTGGGLSVAKTIHCTDLVVADQTTLKGKNVVTDSGDATSNTDSNASIKTNGGIAVAKKVYANNLQAVDTVSGANASFLTGQFTNCDVINNFTCGNFAIAGSFHIPGSLGIGINPPSHKLDIYSNTNGLTPVMRLQSGVTVGNVGSRILLGGNTFNTAIDGVHSNSGHTNFRISTSYAGILYERLRIDEEGRIGINVTNPTTLLHLNDSGPSWPVEKVKIYSTVHSPRIAIGNSDSAFNFIEGTSTALNFGKGGVASPFLELKDSGIHSLRNRLDITSVEEFAGESTALTLTGSTNKATFAGARIRIGGSSALVYSTIYGRATENGGTELQFRVRMQNSILNPTVMTLTDGGNVSIGNTDQAAKVAIGTNENDTTSLDVLRVRGPPSTGTNAIIVKGTNEVRLPSQVKIGEDSAVATGYKLDVIGSTRLQNTVINGTIGTSQTLTVTGASFLNGGVSVQGTCSVTGPIETLVNSNNSLSMRGNGSSKILFGTAAGAPYNAHYSSIESKHIGSGMTEIVFGTTRNIGQGAANTPVESVKIAWDGNLISPNHTWLGGITGFKHYWARYTGINGIGFHYRSLPANFVMARTAFFDGVIIDGTGAVYRPNGITGTAWSMRIRSVGDVEINILTGVVFTFPVTINVTFCESFD